MSLVLPVRGGGRERSRNANSCESFESTLIGDKRLRMASVSLCDSSVDVAGFVAGLCSGWPVASLKRKLKPRCSVSGSWVSARATRCSGPVNELASNEQIKTEEMTFFKRGIDSPIWASQFISVLLDAATCDWFREFPLSSIAAAVEEQITDSGLYRRTPSYRASAKISIEEYIQVNSKCCSVRGRWAWAQRPKPSSCAAGMELTHRERKTPGPG